MDPRIADPSDPQSPAEEALNCATHSIGAALAVAGLVVLVVLAALRGDARHVVAVSVYGASLLLLYVASALYHGWGCRPGGRERLGRYRLKILDHVGIYCLIAGTYTPFLLIVIGGAWGWSLLAVLWGLAVAGTVFKLYFVHRWDFISTMIYLAMGWIGLVAAKPFFERLPGQAVAWIFAGGAAYTIGVVFYLWDRLPFNHAIWHLFVLAGSAFHFLAVLWYVLPAAA